MWAFYWCRLIATNAIMHIMYDDPFDEAPVSKSQRKREAHALQALGESLVKLNKSALAQIPLTDDLRNAIDEARRLHQHGALKRQLQYIGKLMPWRPSVMWMSRTFINRRWKIRTWTMERYG